MLFCDQICPTSDQDPQFKINKRDLFSPLGIYFIFGTKFSWNEGNDTCFNVECVLLHHNFHFFGGYLVVTARYLVVTARYLVVTVRYRSVLLLSTFSMSARNIHLPTTTMIHSSRKTLRFRGSFLN